MESNKEKINLLASKFMFLLKKQESLNKDLEELKKEIDQLKNADTVVETKEPIVEKPIEVQEEKVTIEIKEKPAPVEEVQFKQPKKTKNFTLKTPTIKSDIEKFIGENLINKIGIIVIIIGVAIGAKYAIDNELISPTVRIILGYLVGLGLFGFALKLKEKYHQFSAALYSGAMAIIYFITFAAFSFYDLFPAFVAYSIMVITTIVTVAGAIKYDRQVIAHIGLVGAYAIPFLLSKETTTFEILYSYVAIINIGILYISFKKNWKYLYYTAFVLTWSIVLLGYSTSVNTEIVTTSNLAFATIYFIIFYAIILAYKLINKELFKPKDVFLILLNSFIYYGIGYAIILNQYDGESYLGLFTLCNALFHLGVCSLIYYQKLYDKNLFYLVLGIGITFITIAIPVELKGNWITLLWGAEAVLLFWLGRTKKINYYEYFSYPLIFFTFLSLLGDWGDMSIQIGSLGEKITPIFNIYFLTSIVCSIFFGAILYFHRKIKIADSILNNSSLYPFINIGIPIIFIFTLYTTFRNEIDIYWVQLNNNASTSDLNNSDFLGFNLIYQFIYTFFFIGLLSVFNSKKVKNRIFGISFFVIGIIAIVSFLLIGLYELGELRESYLENYTNSNNIYNLLIRYVSFVFLGGLLFVLFKSIKQFTEIKNLKKYFEIFLTITILWVLSSELIHWMDIGDSKQSYKLGLSIFWGVYSLLIISYGIWKKMKHLRIIAIVIFGLTLIKLFFYDIAHLDTISKTVVFLSLGILLLIISFLYNKYKKKIF